MDKIELSKNTSLNSINKQYRNKITKTKIRMDSDSENDSNTSDISDDDDDDDDGVELIQNEKLSNYESEIISKFIIKDKITDFNSKSIFCYYLWSGIAELDKWELNRKIDSNHCKKIYKEMIKDFDKKGEFIFYEPIHLAIKSDNIFYVIDGQHRLVACNKIYKKNKYPIQQIPCIIWFPNDEEEFIEIFDKINSRTLLDKTKLFNYKINDIITWMDKNYGKSECIWGKLRPKINKDLFVEKMRQNDIIHKLETEEIIKKINNYNIKLRGMPRNKRYVKTLNDSVHNHVETIDFYLGYDKELEWVTNL